MQIVSILYFFPPRKQVLTFHANCLHWRQFAWKVKSCFLGKIRKNIISLLPIELAQRVVKVKQLGSQWGPCPAVQMHMLVQHYNFSCLGSLISRGAPQETLSSRLNIWTVYPCCSVASLLTLFWFASQQLNPSTLEFLKWTIPSLNWTHPLLQIGASIKNQ